MRTNICFFPIISARLNLARWYNDVEAFGYDGFSKVIETFENHNDTIINYF